MSVLPYMSAHSILYLFLRPIELTSCLPNHDDGDDVDDYDDDSIFTVLITGVYVMIESLQLNHIILIYYPY